MGVFHTYILRAQLLTKILKLPNIYFTPLRHVAKVV